MASALLATAVVFTPRAFLRAFAIFSSFPFAVAIFLVPVVATLRVAFHCRAVGIRVLHLGWARQRHPNYPNAQEQNQRCAFEHRGRPPKFGRLKGVLQWMQNFWPSQICIQLHLGQTTLVRSCSKAKNFGVTISLLVGKVGRLAVSPRVTGDEVRGIGDLEGAVLLTGSSHLYSTCAIPIRQNSLKEHPLPETQLKLLRYAPSLAVHSY